MSTSRFYNRISSTFRCVINIGFSDKFNYNCGEFNHWNQCRYGAFDNKWSNHNKWNQYNKWYQWNKWYNHNKWNNDNKWNKCQPFVFSMLCLTQANEKKKKSTPSSLLKVKVGTSESVIKAQREFIRRQSRDCKSYGEAYICKSTDK
eukprot:293157_1